MTESWGDPAEMQSSSLSAGLRLVGVAVLLATSVAMCALFGLLRPDRWRPAAQAALLTQSVYAYRDWQSTGQYMQPGDAITIRADGQWQYSPVVGLNGPDGGRPAPESYPVPGLGGVLVGRIGDAGTPFRVGQRVDLVARSAGLLYLRINDDRLGDNKAALSVRLSRPPARPVPTPVESQ